MKGIASITVKELRKILQKYPPNMPVVITEGHTCRCYSIWSEQIGSFEGTVDIGIGGHGIRFNDATRHWQPDEG